MAMKLSRRKLSAYVAQQIQAGDTKIYQKLAAYLVQNRRVRELPLIERDIEEALLDHGVARASVTSARPLSAQMRRSVERYIKKHTGAASIVLDETIDDDVIGGVRVQLPGRELDTTVRQRLQKLMKQKVTE